MQILRDGKAKELVVTVSEQPENMAALGKKGGGADLGNFGLALQDLTKEVADQFGYSKDQGVLIADVEADSTAAQLGLQSGMLIEEVNRIRVHNLAELRQALKKVANSRQVLLRVRSGDNSQYVVLQGE